MRGIRWLLVIAAVSVSSVIGIEQFDDPAAFLAAAEPLLAADRARSTIIATVAAGLVTAPDPGMPVVLLAVRVAASGACVSGDAGVGGDAVAMRRARDGDVRTGGGVRPGGGVRTGGDAPRSGDVVAVAVRTPPHPLTVLAKPGASDRPGIFAALAGRFRDVEARTGPVPLLTGPRSDVTDLTAALARTGDLVAHQHTPMLLYRLDVLREPRAVPGSARPADPADPGDRSLLARWFYEFEVQTRTSPPPNGPDPETFPRREARGARHWLWLVDGKPVAMAGHSAVVGGSARIGPVYTPEPLRRRGYGAHVTAAAVRAAQGARAEEVVLFTDADYAPSNAVYRRLGFAVVEEFCEMTLRSAADGG